MSSRIRTGAALALLVGGVAGCDHLLQVQDPDVVTPGQVSGADKLNTNLGASIGAFQVAYGGDGSGGNEGMVNMTGLFTDEFSFAETFPTRKVVDERNTTNNNSTLFSIFFNLQQARAISANASDQYNQFGAGKADQSQVLSNEAYAQLLLAETYCSDVPFSKQNPDATQSNTTPLTTLQMLNTAVATFDSAIDIAVTNHDAPREFLARVGKARALMDLGGLANMAVADTVVNDVPTSFTSQVLHSENTTRENNGVFELMYSEKRWTVGDSEGVNGLPFVSANDPRVGTELIALFTHTCDPTKDPNDPNFGCVANSVGFDGETTVIIPLKDSTRSTPEVLASGLEARLIQAEAALNGVNGGSATTWLADLNALRASAASLGVPGTLPALTDPGSFDKEVRLTMRERAFWLYASAHRLADMRRMTRPTSSADGPVGYGLDIGSVYPVGAWHGSASLVYGTDVNFPVPFEEGNNPNFNAGACDVTTP